MDRFGVQLSSEDAQAMLSKLSKALGHNSRAPELVPLQMWKPGRQEPEKVGYMGRRQNSRGRHGRGRHHTRGASSGRRSCSALSVSSHNTTQHNKHNTTKPDSHSTQWINPSSPDHSTCPSNPDRPTSPSKVLPNIWCWRRVPRKNPF